MVSHVICWFKMPYEVKKFTKLQMEIVNDAGVITLLWIKASQVVHSILLKFVIFELRTSFLVEWEFKMINLFNVKSPEIYYHIRLREFYHFDGETLWTLPLNLYLWKYIDLLNIKFGFIRIFFKMSVGGTQA